MPDYQKSVGQAAGHGLRQVPDVSADGDPSTGFHILFSGREGQAGGTSASTPLWAATVALINQDLKNKGLREVGFADLDALIDATVPKNIRLNRELDLPEPKSEARVVVG